MLVLDGHVTVHIYASHYITHYSHIQRLFVQVLFHSARLQEYILLVKLRLVGLQHYELMQVCIEWQELGVVVLPDV